MGIKDILSSHRNKILNKNFDAPLYKTLPPPAEILNVSRDRREHHLIDFVDDSGKKLTYRSTGSVQIKILPSLQKILIIILTRIYMPAVKKALEIARGIVKSRSKGYDADLEIGDPFPYAETTIGKLIFNI